MKIVGILIALLFFCGNALCEQAQLSPQGLKKIQAALATLDQETEVAENARKEAIHAESLLRNRLGELQELLAETESSQGDSDINPPVKDSGARTIASVPQEKLQELQARRDTLLKNIGTVQTRRQAAEKRLQEIASVKTTYQSYLPSPSK